MEWRSLFIDFERQPGSLERDIHVASGVKQVCVLDWVMHKENVAWGNIRMTSMEDPRFY